MVHHGVSVVHLKIANTVDWFDTVRVRSEQRQEGFVVISLPTGLSSSIS
jgi:hypothetical protein